MGWGTGDHEGYADEKWPDGSWSGPAHRPGDPDAIAYQAVCSCGWRSDREHPVPLPPAEMAHDERDRPYGAEWDSWIAALVAATDASQLDWRAEHFEPLLGCEPHALLIEAPGAGGRRHYLGGRPVHAGTALELLLADGHWLRGRYEWSFVPGELPTLHVWLGGPAEAQRQGDVPSVAFTMPARAVLRWPASAERDAGR